MLENECRMEAVPSVPFHERAPDLMKEEDVQNNQIEAEEAANMVQGSCWPPSRDMREGLPEEKQQRADISYRLSKGEAHPIRAETQKSPVGTAGARDTRGDASQVLSAPSATGKLLHSTSLSNLSSSDSSTPL